MIRIDDLLIYTRVAALGSFTAAANDCGTEPANVSAAMRRLERALGVVLLFRSTRSVRLTEEGLRYLPYAQRVTDRVRDSARELRLATNVMKGTVRLGVPSDLGRNLLADWLGEFTSAHPEVHLEVKVGGNTMDVFRAHVDAAIRYETNASEGNHVALPILLAHPRVLVASPRYLRTNGSPPGLTSLASHACLVSAEVGQSRHRWHFPGATPAYVDVPATRVSDDETMLRQWAIEGDGIAYKPWIEVANDVRMGTLSIVLPGEATEDVALSMACADRHQLSPALRLLHRWIVERCGVFLEQHPVPGVPVCA